MDDASRPPQGYPAMPAYGEGRQTSRADAARGVPDAEPVRPSGGWLAVGMSVVFNLVTLVGVLAFGWPPGNVFVLFWVENAVLGLCTLVKVAGARLPSRDQVLVNDRPAGSSPALYAVFFCIHYGIFCLVHLVFTAIVAYQVGFVPGVLFLAVPVALLLLRYAVELATTWFGAGGQRDRISPQQAMMQPYPRVIVLHVSVLLAFFVVLTGFAGGSPLGEVGEVLRRLLTWVPTRWRTDGVAVVAILLVVKTVVDVLTTRRALRPR